MNEKPSTGVDANTSDQAVRREPPGNEMFRADSPDGSRRAATSRGLHPALPWLALLMLVAGGMTVWMAVRRAGRDGHGSVEKPDPDWRPPGSDKPVLTEFTLTERSGKKFDSTSLAGQVHVTSFFYANCPTYCRLQNTKLADLEREFAKKGVMFISITCDPDSDTPNRLAEYADQFQADRQRWLFLTGDFPYLRRVAGEIYQVRYDRQSHVENFLVYDRWGKQRGRFHWNKSPEIAEMRKLLDQLLAEKEPPPDEPPARVEIDEETGLPRTVQEKPVDEPSVQEKP